MKHTLLCHIAFDVYLNFIHFHPWLEFQSPLFLKTVMKENEFETKRSQI